MKMKKILSVLLCIIMMLSVCVPVSFGADYCEHVNGFDWVVTAQTCRKEGKRELKCRDCDYVSKTEVIPPHDYKPSYVIIEATCQVEGVLSYYCAWCNTSKTVNVGINENNHKYGDWYTLKESNCKEEGLQERKCTLCQAKNTSVIPLDYSKHIPAENAVWETVYPSECFAVGTERTLCTVCNKYITRDIPSHRDAYDGSLTGDAFTAKYKLMNTEEGTCSRTGSKLYICQICSRDVSVATGLAADNHKYSTDWVVEKLSTSCTAPGVRYRYCIYNGSHIERESYTQPHDFSVPVSYEPATECFGKSAKVMKCKNCDATEKFYENEEHIFGDWKYVSSDKNCATGGAVKRTCQCGASSQEKVAAAGEHLNYKVISDVNPTCLYIGYQDIQCKDCASIARIFPEGYTALGHKASAWITTEEATCKSSGMKIKQCERCFVELEREVIPQLPHSFGILVQEIPATCTKEGMSAHRLCMNCGREEFPEVIAASGHNFIKQIHDDGTSAMVCDKCYEYKVGEGEDGAVTCKCMCHNADGIAAVVYKIITFFNRLSGKKQICECGKVHYEGVTGIKVFFEPFLKIFNKK